MKRHKQLTRKALMRNKRAGRRRSSRVYSPEFLRFVKTLLCSVEEEWPVARAVGWESPAPTMCTGVIEADHLGYRGLGQKCSDNEAAPMCTGHHRERTDHNGTFKHLTQEEEREWRERQIRRTQTLWAEAQGHRGDW